MRDLYELGDLARPDWLARREAIHAELAELAPDPRCPTSIKPARAGATGVKPPLDTSDRDSRLTTASLGVVLHYA